MSDNDLIRRGDAYEAIYALYADGKEGIMNAPWNSYGEELRDVLDAISDIPAVPQEMSAREYLEKKRRMCDFYNIKCENCPMSPSVTGWRCNTYELFLPEEAIAIVEKWAKEHPERSEK